jgi:hypothetical protein
MHHLSLLQKKIQERTPRTTHQTRLKPHSANRARAQEEGTTTPATTPIRQAQNKTHLTTSTGKEKI